MVATWTSSSRTHRQQPKVFATRTAVRYKRLLIAGAITERICSAFGWDVKQNIGCSQAELFPDSHGAGQILQLTFLTAGCQYHCAHVQQATCDLMQRSGGNWTGAELALLCSCHAHQASANEVGKGARAPEQGCTCTTDLLCKSRTVIGDQNPLSVAALPSARQLSPHQG